MALSSVLKLRKIGFILAVISSIIGVALHLLSDFWYAHLLFSISNILLSVIVFFLTPYILDRITSIEDSDYLIIKLSIQTLLYGMITYLSCLGFALGYNIMLYCVYALVACGEHNIKKSYNQFHDFNQKVNNISYRPVITTKDLYPQPSNELTSHPLPWFNSKAPDPELRVVQTLSRLHKDIQSIAHLLNALSFLYPVATNSNEAYKVIKNSTREHTSEDILKLGMQQIRTILAYKAKDKVKKYRSFQVLSALYIIYSEQNFDLKLLRPIATSINRRFYPSNEQAAEHKATIFHEYVTKHIGFNGSEYSTSYPPEGGYLEITSPNSP